MLVVADSSPLNLLVSIGYIEVLPKLFSRVVIPNTVAGELSHQRTPSAVKEFVSHPPAWLQIRQPRVEDVNSPLDPGERDAISLAIELDADFILIDEKAGRRVAKSKRLTILGSIGVLQRAAQEGLLDLAEAVRRVRQTDFRVSDDVLNRAIRDASSRG